MTIFIKNNDFNLIYAHKRMFTQKLKGFFSENTKITPQKKGNI